LILAVFAAVSYRELLDILSLSIKPIFQLPSHKGNGTFFEQINLHLLSTEFLFIVLTFLIGVNFINIVRPMPIGWDDLGVYMNYPNMIAAAGGLPAGFGFAGWQIFTGIGFLFESNTQAFFMNQVGGILMVVALAFAVL
jgi:hypothetical protein